MKKYLPKIIIGVLVLLALTNPTQNDFRGYAELKSGLNKKQAEYTLTTSRTSYFLICSVYQYSSPTFNKRGRYFGIFKTFIEIYSN
jgi:hypothetical protein